MLRTTKAHPEKIESINSNTPVIDLLIQEIARKATDSNFHRKTPFEIEKILNRKLKKPEKSAWSRHRQEFIRNEQRRAQETENEKRRAEAIRKKELLTFGLLGHTNEELCEKIMALEIAHTQKVQGEDGSWKEKRGRDSTRQLIRALALHDNTQIILILLQTETFTPEQRARAQDAIATIADYYNGIECVRRGKFLLTELTGLDLTDEIVSIFEAGAKLKWDNFLNGFLRHKLDDLTDPQTVRQLQRRIAGLSLTSSFTKEMKKRVIEYIDEYLTAAPKQTRGLANRNTF